MCGIVGYVGHREAIPFLLTGLRRLEYRGYDSAGLATLNGKGLEVRKAAGKIAALESRLGDRRPEGRLGIAHTRWATHGRPSDDNAHPHTDCGARLAVVHNGIIENHRPLRDALLAQGHRFRSQTDSEVIAHLVESHAARGLPAAVRVAAGELRGAFAIACIAEADPAMLVAARSGGSPLVIGIGEGELLLASDIPALLGSAREVLVLEDGEMAVLKACEASVTTLRGEPVRRRPMSIPWDSEAAEKNGYPHFMLKEIFEQPEAVRNTLRERVSPDGGPVSIPELGMDDAELAGLRRVAMVACGTSWHAALVGKYLVEAFARLPVDVEIASEFRYREPVLDSGLLTVAITQSGETADTLGALREARQRGARTLAICNVVGSSAARDAGGVLYTRAGLEIGVASTKAFTAQLAAVELLALRLGQARGTLDPALGAAVARALWESADAMQTQLRRCEELREVAGLFAESRDLLYLGRGLHYPLALEGALKLKEISYIHAEGYAAGEMKHGPLALIDDRMPVVAIALRGPHYEKMAANIEEVKAREGIVIALAAGDDAEARARADVLIPVPDVPYWAQPLVAALPLQMLAYHLGVLRGCHVDQPRNLAKSVTVE
ncbi:MAG TPA: glutamine--fructose-6-phosphate transaminase (isomerizing) [Candidatus Polarisedimenticolia bacterium]|nr:glutamine--fructose-6-phosphate transaminase (isomerizing) [Candidatus Polarisedimenticolia bacterium]